MTSQSTFHSGSGNALLLIANEIELLRRLDFVIVSGNIPEACAILVFTVLVSRRSQLLYHVCYRACDGRKATRFLMNLTYHHRTRSSGVLPPPRKPDLGVARPPLR